MNPVIRYFAERPLLCNVVLFGLIILSVFVWKKIGKEEYPDFAHESVRVTLNYPGAAAENVELLVTRPVEDEIRNVSGVAEVSSTARFGGTTVRVDFEKSSRDLDSLVADVKDAVSKAQIPEEVDEPEFRQFNTAEKAIIDIALFHRDKRLLDPASRTELQDFAKAFENRLTALGRISGVNVSGYLKPEIQIEVDPKKLARYELTMSEIRQKIRDQNVRLPVGSMSDRDESAVTVLAERTTPEALGSVILRSGFSGPVLRLADVATIHRGFEKSTSLLKVQGHEAVAFNVKKTISSDILSAQEDVIKAIEDFKTTYSDSPVGLQIMDDESTSVRDRIGLIASNGLLGFALIVFMLFLFLNLRTGIWVAFGIPFSLAFTLCAAILLGYTVNNMTLCAIIIVIGIVVDDAIIVAENVDRKVREGMSPLLASVEGTAEVIKPVIAAILTTCAAFVPFYFFEARFGAILKAMPMIIFLMLAASLLESAFILPSHLRGSTSGSKKDDLRSRFLLPVERLYERITQILLRVRVPILLVFTGLLVYAVTVFRTDMKFAMFPREEATSIAVRVVAEEGTNRFEMARLTEGLEDLFISDPIVTSVSTNIAVSRRGGPVNEHEANLDIELLPADQREKSLNEAIALWEEKGKSFSDFKEIRFIKNRWGLESSSPIEIEVLDNNDESRAAAIEKLVAELKAYTFLTNVEVERPLTKPEYRLEVKDDLINRLGVSTADLSASLRSYLEGTILYSVTSGEEEVFVRLSSSEKNKGDIDKLLSAPIGNRDAYLIPMAKLVQVEKGMKPTNIARRQFKRSATVYADIAPGQSITPLEVATKLESEVFPKIAKDSPLTSLQFRGEVEDTRESQSDFGLAAALVLGLIYVFLIFLYNSLTVPLLIASVIPFGAIGVIFAFVSHNMATYGFFAVVGTLGMIGVVVNDSIVMVSKFEEQFKKSSDPQAWRTIIPAIAASRLRPVALTTITTVAGLFPTAYGIMGYDSMLAEMMLAMGWGLVFATTITLVFLPCLYSLYAQGREMIRRFRAAA